MSDLDTVVGATVFLWRSVPWLPLSLALSLKGEGTVRHRLKPKRQPARAAPSPFRERAGERVCSGGIFQVGADSVRDVQQAGSE